MTEPWTHNVMTVNGFRMHYVTKQKKGAPISRPLPIDRTFH
jgi:hypothetical protein